MPNKTTSHRFQVIQGGRKTPPPAPPTARQIFERGIVESLAPAGPAETTFAVAIAQGYWHMKQLREAEFNLSAQGRSLRQYSADLAKITLCENRVLNSIERFHKHLLGLRQDRRTREATARAKALVFLKQALLEGSTPDPGRSVEQDGFVFSIGELLVDMARARPLHSGVGKRAQKPKAS